MKRMLSLLMVLVMLFTCVFSALAETTENLDALKEAEMETLMEWLSTQIPEEEVEQVLTWDRDTILEKLEGYDQPLEYITKEEAADQLAQVLGLFTLFSQAAESEDGEEAMMGMLGGLFGGLTDGAADEGGEALEGLLGLFGGFMGGEEGFTGVDYGEDTSYVIDNTFDGTYWESGETKLASFFQDGYYKVLVTKGDEEFVYLCDYAEHVSDDDVYYISLNSIGTGDDELAEEQSDHGVAIFVYYPMDEKLIWEPGFGEGATFTRIIDPLDGAQYFNGVNTLTIHWLGDTKYQVNIDDWVNFVSWSYECVLDKETDVLTGTGSKSIVFGGEGFEDDTATFAFQNARNQLVWTSEKEEAAQSGLEFEHIEQDLMAAYWWNEEGYSASIGWVTCYYLVQAYLGEETSYSYLCTYDRDQNAFVSVDVAPIDFESINLFLEKEEFSNGGTFTLKDDNHLVWKDDAVTPADGIVLDRS
ncbi:MAG: hypothetical protein IJ188_00640 [Clostridia bacterium]|nr:hypothetical protein [Clostridia bacterium]